MLFYLTTLLILNIKKFKINRISPTCYTTSSEKNVYSLPLYFMSFSHIFFFYNVHCIWQYLNLCFTFNIMIFLGYSFVLKQEHKQNIHCILRLPNISKRIFFFLLLFRTWKSNENVIKYHLKNSSSRISLQFSETEKNRKNVKGKTRRKNPGHFRV